MTQDQALILSDVIMQRLGSRETETRAIALTAEEARAICDFLEVHSCTPAPVADPQVNAASKPGAAIFAKELRR